MTVVTFYLTGFGKFQGVTNNPTTQIMEKLPVYLQSNPLKSKVNLHVLNLLILIFKQKKKE